MSERHTFSIVQPPISGEVQGNSDSRKVVILSHGFGVQRDSRGMYSELAQRLQDKHLVVLFDYVDIDEEGNTTAHPLTEQSEMLDAVLDYIRKIYSPEEITIIAHSQGCIVVGLSQPRGINKIILNSPRLSTPDVESARRTFGSRRGTHITDQGMSTISRSDGTKTYVPRSFWDTSTDMKPLELIRDLASNTKVVVVRANQDHILADQDYSEVEHNPNITFVNLDGNHDFDGDDREAWLDTIHQLIDG